MTRRMVVAALAICICAVGLSPARAVEPSIKLFVADNDVTIDRFKGDTSGQFFDAGVYVTPVGGNFELHATIPDYDHPNQVSATQVGAPSRLVQPADVEGFNGLENFTHIEITQGGPPVVSNDALFCPNGYGAQRLNDSGPLSSTYPLGCFASTFTKGAVWGIDDGWAVNSFAYGEIPTSVPDGDYTMTVSINEPFRTLFEVTNPSDYSKTITIHLETVKSPNASPRAREQGAAPSMSPPQDTNPAPSTEPDLVAYPAWSISTFKEKKKWYVGFNATEGNLGAAPLVIEGFRNEGDDTMQARQYFYSGGSPVAYDDAGSLEYHAGGGHNHWHLLQFAKYELLDNAHTPLDVDHQSGKQSWCLAPTDMIDTTIPGANYQPDNGDLHTACGDQSSIWVRETLDVGWADTYSQSVSGQAFKISGLPDGDYYIRVSVNPDDVLHESDTGNNAVERKITIHTNRKGKKTVTAEPWHGQDI